MPPGSTSSDRPSARLTNRSVAGRMVNLAASNIGRTGVTLVLGLIFTPLLISTLGLTLFGLFMFISQLTSWLIAPIRNALIGAMTLHFSRAIARRDDDGFRRVFSAALIMTLAGGAVIVAGGALVALLAEQLLRFDPALAGVVRLAIALEAGILAARVACSPFVNLDVASQRMIVFNLHEVAMRATNLGAILIVLGAERAGLSIAGLRGEDPATLFGAFVIVRFALQVGYTLVRSMIARLSVPQARVAFREVRLADMRAVAGTGAWSTADPFVRMAFFMGDNYLLNLFLGPVYNGLYAVINQVRGYSRILGGQLISGSQAISTSLHEEGKHEQSRRMVLVNVRMVGGFVAISAAVIVVLFRPLIDVWLGAPLRADEDLASIMTYDRAVALAQAYVLVLLFGGMIMESSTAATHVLYGRGMVKHFARPVLVAGVAKIAFSVPAIWITREPLALPFVTLLCQVALYGLVIPRIIAKAYDLRYGSLFWHGILVPLASAVPVALVCVAARGLVDEWNWFSLVASFASAGLTGALCVGLLLLRREDRASVLRLVTARLARRRRDEPSPP